MKKVYFFLDSYWNYSYLYNRNLKQRRYGSIKAAILTVRKNNPAPVMIVSLPIPPAADTFRIGTVIDSKGRVWNGPKMYGRFFPTHGERIPFFVWENWTGSVWVNIRGAHGCTVWQGACPKEARKFIKGYFAPNGSIAD